MAPELPAFCPKRLQSLTLIAESKTAKTAQKTAKTADTHNFPQDWVAGLWFKSNSVFQIGIKWFVRPQNQRTNGRQPQLFPVADGRKKGLL
jgi:hypothetical protein